MMRVSKARTQQAKWNRERKGNATSTRAKEEHVKEFEGCSMKATAVVNMVFVSREYSMIVSRL
jgi:hypothetical protein